jgi:hypothetical protein
MTQASLVQDLWLGFGTRLRGRRLAPFDEPGARLFQLDPCQSLDAPPVAADVLLAPPWPAAVAAWARALVRP